MQVSFGGTVIQRRSVGEAAFSETRHDPLTHLARHSHAHRFASSWTGASASTRRAAAKITAGTM